jgi:DNA polymerase-4
MTDIILHIDMDAYFASIEQRDNPELKGKPVAVGGVKQRGVVAAASYEARKFGIRSAMPSHKARQLCKSLIFISPRFEVYKSDSLKIKNIFHEYSELVEPLSLDESYIDISHLTVSFTQAADIALEIKQKIKDETKLTASAGISYNKFLAKTASDYDKPDGLYIIRPEQAENFLKELPIRKFFGIGAATAKKMNAIGVQTGADLLQKTEQELVQYFGKAGRHFYSIVRGIDNRPVNPHRVRKSVGVERTFDMDVNHINMLYRVVEKLSGMLIERVQRHNKKGHTLTLKLKYKDFTIVSKSKTYVYPINPSHVEEIGKKLLDLAWDRKKGVRLLGLTLSNLEGNEGIKQLQLDM